MSSKPFSPAEAGAAQGALIPDAVFDSVNELLSMRAHQGKITINQDELIELILLKSEGGFHTITRSMLFENNWLDIETAYRKAGWDVEYDKPGYCESYTAYWRFAEALPKTKTKSST